VSATTGLPVGFWWAELTHPYFHFTEAGYEVEVFSPQGGPCVADPISDPEHASQWQAEDVISRAYKHDPAFVKLVENTRKVDDIDLNRFDAIVVAGGQGPMFTFQAAENLHRKFVEFYQSGRLTAALCHGVAILRYAWLATGEPLVKGKRSSMTWTAPCGRGRSPWRSSGARTSPLGPHRPASPSAHWRPPWAATTTRCTT
jgi:putative intracellular protease/amidase